MKRFAGLTAVLVPAFLGGAPAQAADWYTGAEPVVRDDAWTTAVDASASVTSNSSAFGSLTGTFATEGTLLQSGPRIRVEAVAGTYSYPGQGVAQRVTGYQEEAALSAGYEWIWRDAALAGFVGFNVRSNQLSILDPDNPVVGTGVGAKFGANFYARPTENTMVSAYGSYSTQFNAYYTRFRVGYMVADGVYVGPEAMVLGDNFFSQYRIGAHVSGFSIGPIKMAVGVGYVKDRIQGSGYYSSVEARAAF
ncbi:cellulose biosynthesis protein BcsS [Methylobacterium sp. 77]|uniref:cellulose biosynthesis protein BcsS n=1 Tax=Methylobacterium sp. 77 TaxID=1101192 RepID=UPI000372FA70|nr:cellulose biosynthesis protein BcsS [Methylobacterium sp. 77]